MSERPHVANGTSETVLIGGFGTIYKVLSDATGGSVAVIEHTLEPGLLAAPLHRHTHEEEISYVLEGEVTVQQGPTLQRRASAPMWLSRAAYFTQFGMQVAQPYGLSKSSLPVASKGISGSWLASSRRTDRQT